MDSPLPLSAKLVVGVLPALVLVSAIFWLVHALDYAKDGPQQDGSGRQKVDKYTISFQAVVAFTAIYYLLITHYGVMMR